jgi:hypothetical protein
MPCSALLTCENAHQSRSGHSASVSARSYRDPPGLFMWPRATQRPGKSLVSSAGACLPRSAPVGRRLHRSGLRSAPPASFTYGEPGAQRCGAPAAERPTAGTGRRRVVAADPRGMAPRRPALDKDTLLATMAGARLLCGKYYIRPSGSCGRLR